MEIFSTVSARFYHPESRNHYDPEYTLVFSWADFCVPFNGRNKYGIYYPGDMIEGFTRPGSP